ncbi:hypothetical protein [Seonamhaeicola sp. ML3]|uniref:hypothetical protein n=1 Tax=Seonamhaeicola sp. ML3 TaxID=2937786 RepID=UPI00200BA327|nr:hypothetical protein [Seonamhaeicola sp. ML3]
MKKGALIVVMLFLFISTHSCLDLLDKANRVASELDSSPESTSESNYQTIAIDSVFKVDVPNYMKPLPNLNPEAVLQYGNIYKDAYLVVIQENKEEYINLFKELGEYNPELPVIENYKNVQKEMLKESINNARISEYGLTNINNKPARQIKVFGEVEDVEAAYIIAFVEGKEDIFMLMNWTVKNKFQKHENAFEYVNGTFKTE